MKKLFTMSVIFLLVLFPGCNKRCEVLEEVLPKDLTMQNKLPDVFKVDIDNNPYLNKNALIDGYVEAFKQFGEVFLVEDGDPRTNYDASKGPCGTIYFYIPQLWQGDMSTFEKKLPVLKVNLSAYFYLTPTYQVPQLNWDKDQYIGQENQEITTKRVAKAIYDMLDMYMFKYKVVRQPKVKPIFYLIKNKVLWEGPSEIGSQNN